MNQTNYFWNGLRIFERIDCVRLHRLYIFEYYDECETAYASTYLERSNKESTHIYGLLVTPRQRGAESAELISI